MNQHRLIGLLAGDRKFNRRLLSLAIPSMFQNLMLALVAAGDAVLLSRVGQDAMSAVSLASQVQFVQNLLLCAFVGGAGVMGAQYWGRGDRVAMGRIFGMSVRYSLVASVAFFIGCFCFPRFLMGAFAEDEVLLDLGGRYLRVASWSYLLTGLSQCYLGIMRVSDHAVLSASLSSGAVLLNIVFNAVFIFGLLGAPALGVEGAAVATVLARVVELLLCVLLSLRGGCIRLTFRDLATFHWPLIRDFWHFTLPMLGGSILWGVGYTAYTAIMGHLGRDAAAANAVVSVVRDLMCCLGNGLAVGGGILIGNELGAGRLEQGRLYGKRMLAIGLLVGVLIMAVIMAMTPAVANAMTLTPQAQGYMVGMFLIMAVYMIGRTANSVIFGGIFAAGGDTMFDMVSLSIFMWCLALPLAFLGAFYFHFPVLAVYACSCLDEVGKLPWVIHHFRLYKWVKNITR